MKYLVKESQYKNILEYFSPMENLKTLLNYYLNLDQKKPYGTKDYKSYKSIKLFQKYVDLVFKYTKKISNFDGVERIMVGDVIVSPWGEDFSHPENPPSRLDWKVHLYPVINKNNPPKSQEEFEEQYDEFKKNFEMVSRGMGMEYIQPVEDKKTKTIKIEYVFGKVYLKDWVTEELGKDESAKWLKCKNCKKKFTQTIHKGKKSLPICPHCGTHNKKDSDERAEQ
jgi:hypothetical protein